MIEPDRIPEQVFSTTPVPVLAQWLEVRPDREDTLRAFNRTHGEFMAVRNGLQLRYDRGEFDGLSDIVLRMNAGETPTPEETNLMRDFRTLVDGEIARYSRRNLIAASDIREWQDQKAAGYPPLTQLQEDSNILYQEGMFDEMVINIDRPLPYNLRMQRYTYPAGEDDDRIALTSGARTEALIRFLGSQIAELTGTGFEERVRELRMRRDILFTQSSPYLESDPKTRKEQIRTDAFFNSKNPMLEDNVIRNWLNGENLANGGLVLDIPRDMRRDRRWWLFLPLILPLPFVELNGQICDSGREPHHAYFRTEAGDPKPSVEGAILEQMGNHEMGGQEINIPDKNDPEFFTTVEDLKVKKPEFSKTFLERAWRDLIRTNDRIRGGHKDEPWLNSYPYSDRYIYDACPTTPEMVNETNEYIARRNDANPLARAWNWVRERYEDRPRLHIPGGIY